jgi:hypothetical protein
MLLNVAEGFKSGAVPHIVFSEGWKQYGEQSHPDSLKALDHFNIEFKVSVFGNKGSCSEPMASRHRV